MDKNNEYRPTLPTYIEKLYPIYESKKWSSFFDSPKLLSFITFGYRKKLIQAVLREITQSQKILQIGGTFGDQIDKTSEKIGYYGKYHLVDVSHTQSQRCKDKYKGILHNMNFSNQNALARIEEKYDGVILFMLLHELPSSVQKEMIAKALETTSETGKVIIIDYHKPKSKFIQKLYKFFNRLYQPFVEDFWEQDLTTLVPTSDQDFLWTRYTLKSDTYQVVVASRVVNYLK